MARDVTIRYVGDSDSAERATRRVRDANQRLSQNVGRMHTGISSKFGSLGVTFRRFGQTAAIGIAGAGFLAVKLGTDFVKAAEESQKVGRQTNAVLESTGGVARVTADHVSKLAEKLSLKAGIDDELIQSGQNVLLTFTSIRNEVGKGNDIFDQATATALNMSVALGQDMQSSVIQLGKALQDPVRGITALRRVGVNFSEDQVKVIKRLVETGDTLGAQKLILEELTKEFGGSAEAQATASGKLSVAWDNLKERLGERLLPVMEAFSDWMVEKGIPYVESFADWIENEAVPALQDFGGWIKDHVVPPLQTMGDILKDTVIPALQGVAEWIGDKVTPLLEGLEEGVAGNNEELKKFESNWAGWAVAAGAAAVAAGAIAAALTPLVGVIKGVGVIFGFLGFAATNAFNLIVQRLPFVHIASVALLFRDQIVGIFGWAWERIKSNASEAWELVKFNLGEAWNAISAEALKFQDRIFNVIGGAWNRIKSNASEAWELIKFNLGLAWDAISSRAVNTWGSIRDRITNQWKLIKSNISLAAGWVRDKLAGIWDSIKAKVSGVWTGISNGLRRTWDTIKGVVRGGVNAVIGVINGLIGGVNWVLRKLKIPEIPTISRLREARSADLNRPTRGGMAAGGVVPLGRSGPFVTNGPTVVVGEGRRQYPEYVIPTDPQHRGRALGLLGQLGSQLLPLGTQLPGLQFGGIVGAFKGGFNFAKDKLGGLAGSVLRKALEVGFGPFNTAARVGLNALPNPMGIRDIAQKARESVWEWVKGADSALPTAPPPGAGGTGRGGGVAGLREPVASIAKRMLELAGSRIWIISGWRSRAQQAALYARYLSGSGNLAARPGTSKHERGLAVDWGGDVGLYQRLARSLGAHFPVSGERWHMEVPGYKAGGVVPRDGPAFLHRGERVIPARANHRGDTIINITVQGSVVSERELTETITRNLARQNGRSSVRVR
jgi:hypothetical protein